MRPALPWVCRNAQQRILLQAALREQLHQTARNWGTGGEGRGGGVPPGPEEAGDAILAAQRLSETLSAQARSGGGRRGGGGIEEQKPSRHRFLIPSQSSLTPASSFSASAAAKAGL